MIGGIYNDTFFVLIFRASNTQLHLERVCTNYGYETTDINPFRPEQLKTHKSKSIAVSLSQIKSVI